MTENKNIKLNQVIGYHLLTFLDGIDKISFIEAANNSEQFGSIAAISDQYFIRFFKVLSSSNKIYFKRGLFETGTNEFEIIDGRLIEVSKFYSCIIEPTERIYIHHCFSVEGFWKLCEIYNATLFLCCSRLLSFNSSWYDADFGLLDYKTYAPILGSERKLNDYEKDLFKVNLYFHTKENLSCHSNLKFVRTIEEFQKNLETRFSSTQWLDAIDFTKFVIVGGCVLNALCQSSFADTEKQDINFMYYRKDVFDFHNAIEVTIANLRKMVSANSLNEIRVEKVPGASTYNVFLPNKIQLSFSSASIGNSKYPLSHILHNFDMDISQIAFTGNKIVSTFAFLQALATKSFIVYSLHAGIPKHVCTRIQKYCDRGFNLLEPIGFDGDFGSLMAQEEQPIYRMEHHQYIDDEGEIYIGTKEYRRMPVRNVDTYQIQEKFINMVCSMPMHHE